MILDVPGFAHARTDQVDLMELFRQNGRKLTGRSATSSGSFCPSQWPGTSSESLIILDESTHSSTVSIGERTIFPFSPRDAVRVPRDRGRVSPRTTPTRPCRRRATCANTSSNSCVRSDGNRTRPDPGRISPTQADQYRGWRAAVQCRELPPRTMPRAKVIGGEARVR
jgi:hypothetical protein